MPITYKFKAAYTRGGISYNPSSAPTCTVVDSANNILANAQPVTLLSNLPGVCLYSYVSASPVDVIGLFKTSDISVDCQDLYSYVPDFLSQYIDASISSRCTLGSGSTSWPIVITVNAVPTQGVDVWVTTDIAGLNVIASGTTDLAGTVTFLLDPGNYFCWKQKTGDAFTNPESFTVV